MFEQFISVLQKGIGIFLHLDQHLNEWAALAGPWLYLILFMVMFCETGLVVTPFLPGDSLLFALGAMTAVENAVINFWIIGPLLIVAAILGDFTNYNIGKKYGRRLFNSESKLLRHEHLARTERFYLKHGAKTIVMARFVPIVRTFAPFVAGMGQMPFRKFIGYSVAGGVFWVASLLTLGRVFGNIPAVKRNFEFIVLAIIAISVVPMIVEFIKSKRAAKPAL